MKQFKKLAVCLLAAVMALTMFTACGRKKLDITVDETKKEQVAAVLERYLEGQSLPAMTENAVMQRDAEKGLEPSVAYKLGMISKQDFGMEVWSACSMTLDELQQTMNENRYVGFTLPVNEFSDAEIRAKLAEKFKPTVPVSQYGMAVAVYEDVVYVVMFMK